MSTMCYTLRTQDRRTRTLLEDSMLDDWIGYRASELDRIGIVCQGCGTEAIFDLKKDQTANVPHNCPGCDHKLLETTAAASPVYNWVTYYKAGRDAPKNVEIRFYFRRSAP